MASKIDSVMSTSVALETLKASNSINSLTKAVRSSTSAWKAQEAQLKSNGDYLKASEAKYEGLGESIDAEKKRIESLQEKMKDLDQTTQDGAKQAVRYGNDLNKATTALKSMEAQQQRAYEALKREKSGINGLNSSMRQRNSLSKAVTDRLEAEGKHEEALKEKRDNARKSIDDISKALKKEEFLLKDLEKNDGSASAINKQRIAVEKLKTSMAESKSSVSKFDKSLKELNPSPIRRLKNSFSGLKREGKETHSVFKQVFSGTFWGEVAHGAVSQTFSAIKMGFGGIIKAGSEFNKEQQVMNATWTTLTGNASKGEGFVKSINKMSTAFGQSNDLVNELDQQFYHVLNKKGPTEELTKSVLTMADTLGLSAENTQRLGLNFTHMMSSSKMQLGDFNMISDQLPMFGERLLDYERKMQHNNALSMSELRDQMSAGKISAKDAEAVMNGLGKKYKDASENMMKTAAGAERSIKSRFSALSGDLAKPFTTMQSPIFEAVSKWVSDPKTEKKFTEVGKAASKGFQTITTALTKALDIKDGPKTMNKFMDGLARSIKSVSDVIAKHAKQIVGFFKGLWSSIKIVGSIGAGFFSGLISGLGAVVKPLAKMTGHSKAVKGLSGALGDISKHKKGLQTLGKVLAGVFITSKALKFASSITKVGEAVGLLKKSYTPLQLLGKGLGLVKSAFAKLTAVMIANPFVALAAAVIGVTIALVALYKHNKKFRKFVNGIAKAVANFTKSIIKKIKNFFSDIGEKLSSFKKSFKKAWNNMWNSVKKFFANIFDGIHKKFKSWTSAISKTWNGFKSWFGKKWNSMWNGIHDFFHGITKKLSKTFGDWTSGAMDTLGSFGNKFKDGWNGLVKGVKSIFSGLWDSMKNMASDGINAVIDIINKGIGGVNWVINKFGGSKQTIKPIGHVKFATGTGSLGSSNFRRAINQITPAIVNDEVGASNPELIFRKATGTVEYSKEKNAETVLFPGDEVANATDSAKLAPMLGITHFAGGGIGDFFGGIINGAKSVFKKIAGGLKGLFDVGTKIISNPSKALESLMPFSKGSTKGIFPTIAKGGFNFVKNQAKKWWSELWGMVNLSGDGSGSYGGGWQSPGSGWSHTDGFGSSRGGGRVHDGNDFSASIGTPFHAMHGGTVVRVGNPPAGWGDVGYNIVTRDSTGKEIIYQEFGNAKDVKVHQGQHVKTGDTLGVLGHSGLGTGPHLHVGLTKGGSVWNRNGFSTAGWLDITKQHGKDKGSDADSDSSSSGDSSLQQIIKKQVGGGFWSTIKKIASMFGDNGGSGDSPSGHMSMSEFTSIARQASDIGGVKLSDNDIRRLYWQAHVESGVNPGTGGGYDDHDGTGLPVGLFQYKKGTWDAWAKGGHKNIHSALDQILAVIRDSNWRSDLAPYGVTRGWGPTGHKLFADGGIATTPSIFGEAGPEMAIPLSMTRSDRANQLLGETVVHMAKNNPDRLAHEGDYSTGSRDLTEIKALLKDTLGTLNEVVQAIYNTALTDQTIHNANKRETDKVNYLSNLGKGLI
ncbi:tape measure protein [Pediococcus pentosaceus]|uniref:tape measure protein n=1 Tax=Pediococcus pentosaceus TaxID=1255 RepID=UPI000762B40D|nr:tape measure protein [Pediococcus pentosaceus]NEZ68492.1 peptidase M23 [Pediococcus pentosaceus]